MAPQNNVPQPEQGNPQELYALLARSRQDTNEQQTLQTTMANSHSVTIEKVLNELQFNKEMQSGDSVFQHETSAPPLAVLSSLSQKTIPTSFVHETSPMQTDTALVQQDNSTYVLTNMKGFPEGMVPFVPNGGIRPDGSFIPYVCPQNSALTQVRVPGGHPQRFPRPQGGTVHHLGPQFMGTMPLGILPRRPPAVAQLRPMPVPAPQISILPPPISNRPKPTNQATGQPRMSTSSMAPTDLVKKLNEQVTRMQQQLVKSQQGPQTDEMQQQQQSNQGPQTVGIQQQQHSSQGQGQGPTANNGMSVCSNCSNRALFLCAACQNVWYCSKDCQVKSWPGHQIHCISGL